MDKPRAIEKNKIYWTLQGKMNYSAVPKVNLIASGLLKNT